MKTKLQRYKWLKIYKQIIKHIIELNKFLRELYGKINHKSDLEQQQFNRLRTAGNKIEKLCCFQENNSSTLILDDAKEDNGEGKKCPVSNCMHLWGWSINSPSWNIL